MLQRRTLTLQIITSMSVDLIFSQSVILNKLILEKDKNQSLFDFLFNALRDYDEVDENNNFHLQFLLQLTAHLGFSVANHEDFINESTNQKFYKDSCPAESLIKNVF